MLFDVLSYVARNQGAPVTELQKVFGLSSDMAANLVIMAEDAGFLHEQQLAACHHMDANGQMISSGCGTGCSGCGTSCSVGTSFERGCCGMNSPYRVTERGLAFLERMRKLA